jgi:Cu/Ag efflux protein CusF
MEGKADAMSSRAEIQMSWQSAGQSIGHGVRRRSRPAFAAAVLAALVVSALALGACKQEPDAPAAQYTVRGEIKSLPQPGGDAIVYVHHEAIPTFVTREGQQRGMPSMSMPFGVPAGVSGVNLEGLAPGDKVEMTFAVHWDQNPATQITAIRELPADTQLTLSGM